MAKVVDPRVLKDQVITIPGLKPPVHEFIPSDDGGPLEADAFNRMIRDLQRRNPVLLPTEREHPPA